MKTAPAKTECPYCGIVLEYSSTHADQGVDCPECRASFVLPPVQPVLLAAAEKIPTPGFQCRKAGVDWTAIVGLISAIMVAVGIIFWMAGKDAIAVGLAGTILAVVFCGVLVVAVAGCYFLPTIIASRRRHRNEFAILILNLLLGWTLVGWVAALVWALYEEKKA